MGCSSGMWFLSNCAHLQQAQAALEVKQQQGRGGQCAMSPAEPWDWASWKARGWKRTVTATARVKKAQQQEGASVPACWEMHVLGWGCDGWWMARSSRGSRKWASLAAVLGSRALVTVSIRCYRCFRLLLSTFCKCSHRRKPQWGSHCFPPLPPTVPSQTNSGLQRSFLPDRSPCGVFKATAKGPSLLSASQQPQALHFLFSPSRRGSAREKVWHKGDNECHLFWRRGDSPHKSLSC